MAIIFFRQQKYSDSDIIEGLQRGSRKVEEWFYSSSRRYFNEHFNEVFFDKDRKQEIFQSAFLKLWTEIANKKIALKDDNICRQQRDGEYRPMTCSLTTFLMAFAKTENREIMRSTKDVYVGNLFDTQGNAADGVTVCFEQEEDIKEQKVRIIDDCIQEMSPHCIEILTLFYYQKKSLDEILVMRGDKSSTKNGLKSAKTKCMSTLRERANTEFKRYNIYC